jgi:hypothetical protein
MTGPLAPVGTLNLIRASLGIPPDSTFPENALERANAAFAILGRKSFERSLDCEAPLPGPKPWSAACLNNRAYAGWGGQMMTERAGSRTQTSFT